MIPNLSEDFFLTKFILKSVEVLEGFGKSGKFGRFGNRLFGKSRRFQKGAKGGPRVQGGILEVWGVQGTLVFWKSRRLGRLGYL